MKKIPVQPFKDLGMEMYSLIEHNVCDIGKVRAAYNALQTLKAAYWNLTDLRPYIEATICHQYRNSTAWGEKEIDQALDKALDLLQQILDKKPVERNTLEGLQGFSTELWYQLHLFEIGHRPAVTR